MRLEGLASSLSQGMCTLNAPPTCPPPPATTCYTPTSKPQEAEERAPSASSGGMGRNRRARHLPPLLERRPRGGAGRGPEAGSLRLRGGNRPGGGSLGESKSVGGRRPRHSAVVLHPSASGVRRPPGAVCGRASLPRLVSLSDRSSARVPRLFLAWPLLPAHPG